MGFANLITNSNLTVPAAEFYTTLVEDEVIKFIDHLGIEHNVRDIRIDSDDTDLVFAFVNYRDDSIAYLSDEAFLKKNSFISISDIKFGGVKVIGSAGKKIKYMSMF